MSCVLTDYEYYYYIFYVELPIEINVFKKQKNFFSNLHTHTYFVQFEPKVITRDNSSHVDLTNVLSAKNIK